MNKEQLNQLKNLLEKSEVFPEQISKMLVDTLDQLTSEQINTLSKILNEEQDSLKKLK